MSAHYENVRVQAEAAEAALGTFRRALEELSAAALSASRRRRPVEDVYAAVNRLRRAEEAHDLALLDLATARGEDA